MQPDATMNQGFEDFLDQIEDTLPCGECARELDSDDPKLCRRCAGRKS